MIYRTFSAGQAAGIMDYCDNNQISYEIWNVEDMFDQDCQVIELGLSENDWNRLPEYLFEA